MSDEKIDRPIFRTTDLADLSIAGQIVLATSHLGSLANSMRQGLDLEALEWHCQQSLEQLKAGESFGNKRPEEVTRVKLARLRAGRGLALSTAAIAFLKVYHQVNADDYEG